MSVEVEIDADRATKRLRDRFRRAALRVGDELLRELKQRVAFECPQYHKGSGGHSKPGEYPYRESGEFMDGLNVAYNDSTNSLELWSKTDDHHGVYLQFGVPGNPKSARPYASLIVAEFRKILSARIAQAMR